MVALGQHTGLLHPPLGPLRRIPVQEDSPALLQKPIKEAVAGGRPPLRECRRYTLSNRQGLSDAGIQRPAFGRILLVSGTRMELLQPGAEMVLAGGKVLRR